MLAPQQTHEGTGHKDAGCRNYIVWLIQVFAVVFQFTIDDYSGDASLPSIKHSPSMRMSQTEG